MKERQILVLIKEPGKAPYVEPLFDNSLEAFQKAVGGRIETVTITENATIVCNEEGRLIGLPFNAKIAGVDFYGTILVVGVNGDEFASLKASGVPFLVKAIGGNRNGT